MPKTIKIDGVEYTIDRLTFGEVNAILDETMTADAATGKITSKAGLTRTLTVLYGVKNPKLKRDGHELILPDDKKLSNEAGLQLFNEIIKMRNIPLPSSPASSSPIKGQNAPSNESTESQKSSVNQPKTQ